MISFLHFFPPHFKTIKNTIIPYKIFFFFSFFFLIKSIFKIHNRWIEECGGQKSLFFSGFFSIIINPFVLIVSRHSRCSIKVLFCWRAICAHIDGLVCVLAVKLTRQNKPLCANTWAYHSYSNSSVHSHFMVICCPFPPRVVLLCQMCPFPMRPWWSSALGWHTKPWTRLCGGEKMKENDPISLDFSHFMTRHAVCLDKSHNVYMENRSSLLLSSVYMWSK